MATGQNYQGAKQVLEPTVFASTQAPQLVYGASVAPSGGPAPTVTIGAGAGTGTVATISAATGTDFAGNFTVNTGTGGTAAGTLATVTFGYQLPVAPAAVLVTVADAATPTAIAVGAANLATTGFSLVTAAPSASKHYTVNYVVIRNG